MHHAHSGRKRSTGSGTMKPWEPFCLPISADLGPATIKFNGEEWEVSRIAYDATERESDREELERLRQAVADLGAEKGVLSQELQKWKDELVSVRADYERSREETLSLRRDTTSLQSYLTRREDEILTVQRNHKYVIDEYDRKELALRKEVNDLTLSLREVKDKSSSVDYHSEAVVKLRAEVVSAHSEKEILAKQLEALDIAHRQAKEEVGRVTAQLSSSQSAQQQTAELLAKYKEEMSRLSEHFALHQQSSKRDLGLLQDQLKLAQADLANAIKTRSDADAQSEIEVQKVREEMLQALRRQEENFARTRKEEGTQLQAKVMELEDLNSILRREASSTEETLQTRDRDFAALKKELTAEIDALTDQLRQVKRSAASREAEIIRRRANSLTKYTDLQQDYEKEKAENLFLAMKVQLLLEMVALVNNDDNQAGEETNPAQSPGSSHPIHSSEVHQRDNAFRPSPLKQNNKQGSSIPKKVSMFPDNESRRNDLAAINFLHQSPPAAISLSDSLPYETISNQEEDKATKYISTQSSVVDDFLFSEQ